MIMHPAVCTLRWAPIRGIEAILPTWFRMYKNAERGGCGWTNCQLIRLSPKSITCTVTLTDDDTRKMHL